MIIDEIDAGILKSLLKNARTSFVKIAEDFGVPSSTIAKRFNKMKKEGIINGTNVQVNPESQFFDYIIGGKNQCRSNSNR